MEKMLATQNTYVAVKIETTPGEFAEIGNTDFLPNLDDFSHTPGFETVDNKEMSGRLDKKPSRRSMQNGSVSIPVYLKGGSGTNPPWYDALLKSVFDTPSSPISGTNKTVDGNISLATIESSPSPTTTQFDIDAAQAFLQVGDVILVDVSDDGSGEYEQRVVQSAVFDTDHETVVVTEALSAAPTAGNTIQLISRLQIADSPGLSVGDIIAVDVGHSSTKEYESVLVTDVEGTTTQTVSVWPYVSQEPFDGKTVVGGYTYQLKSSGQVTLTVSVFIDCVGQDGIRYDYSGCRFNMKMQGAETGSVAELVFEGEAQKWRVASTGTNFETLGLDPEKGPTHEAPICVGSVIALGSQREIIDTQTLELDLGLTIAKRMSMVASTGIRSSRFSERAVSGTFDLDLLNESQYTAWGAGVRSPLLSQFWDENQTIVMIAPYIKRTNVEDQDSDGIQTQNISWQADPDDHLGTVYFGFLPGGLAPTN